MHSSVSLQMAAIALINSESNNTVAVSRRDGRQLATSPRAALRPSSRTTLGAGVASQTVSTKEGDLPLVDSADILPATTADPVASILSKPDRAAKASAVRRHWTGSNTIVPDHRVPKTLSCSTGGSIRWRRGGYRTPKRSGFVSVHRYRRVNALVGGTTRGCGPVGCPA